MPSVSLLLPVPQCLEEHSAEPHYQWHIVVAVLFALTLFSHSLCRCYSVRVPSGLPSRQLTAVFASRADTGDGEAVKHCSAATYDDSLPATQSVQCNA